MLHRATWGSTSTGEGAEEGRERAWPGAFTGVFTGKAKQGRV